jgi:hypothetical protein
LVQQKAALHNEHLKFQRSHLSNRKKTIDSRERNSLVNCRNFVNRYNNPNADCDLEANESMAKAQIREDADYLKRP